MASANGELIRITQIDASRPPTVDVYVSLEGPSGDAIIGLDPTAFRVIEDGREARADVLSGAPSAVVLVVDRSAGMEGARLDAAKAATLAYVAGRRPSDRVALVTFGDSVTVDHHLDADTSLLTGRIEAIRGGGRAPLYDAMVKALDLLRDVGGRRAVVLAASGADDASRSTLDDVVSQAARDDASIFALGVSTRPPDQLVLQRLAGAAYGDFAYTSPEGLAARYLRIREQLRSEYLLRYETPTRNGRTDRSVEVRVAREDHEVHADGAYIARAAPGIPGEWLASTLVVVAAAALLVGALVAYLRSARLRRLRGAAR